MMMSSRSVDFQAFDRDAHSVYGSVITLTGAAVGENRCAERCFLEHQSQRPRIRNCQLSLRPDIQALGTNVGAQVGSPCHCFGRETRCAAQIPRPGSTPSSAKKTAVAPKS